VRSPHWPSASSATASSPQAERRRPSRRLIAKEIVQWRNLAQSAKITLD
jgi:hypothetical protein